MRVDNAMDDREPKARTFLACCEEWIEDALARFGRNTGSCVLDREHNETTACAVGGAKSCLARRECDLA
jgi:hypothetical protein